MTILTKLNRTLDGWSIHGPIVVAVSGGADSVALLHALVESRSPTEIICGHVNQRLRGSESEADARFVAEQGKSLGVETLVVDAPPSGEMTRSRGIEAAARAARYKALHSIRKTAGGRWIATAHTLDDQAETVLMRLFTNAPVETLSAILPRAPGGVIRPLLTARRNDLRRWLDSRGIEHREDSTNLDMRFLRNRIRHLLLPKLEEKDPGTIEKLGAIAEHTAAIRELIRPKLDSLRELWTRGASRSSLPLSSLPAPGDLRRMMLLDE
ncbi:MAG: tRNA lysidine(34) synthetase TilS, partial [Thermoanaerobaculia bacterium]|nr:tRNA lysidine(34) synthetase TilS [Thermoanaerobaculia bacterium]